MLKLLVSDLHLTNFPNDSYRWDIFSKIHTQLEINNIQELIILGDLTDTKDKHSASLINRMVNEFTNTIALFPNLQIFILKGNHDYIDSDTPFFEFLSALKNIKFIKEPTLINDSFFIPHIHNVNIEYFTELLKNKIFDYLFLHQPFLNAKVQENYKLQNCIDENLIFNKSPYKIFSGDIHIPQTLGNIEYVGAPYPIKFGDTFTGRFIKINTQTNSIENISVNSIKKHLIEIDKEPYTLQNYFLNKNDQCLIKIKLPKELFYCIDSIKNNIIKELEINNIKIYSIVFEKIENTHNNTTKNKEQKDTKDTYKDFCKKENLDIEYIKEGASLLP